jgi:hypothetical protein
MVDVIIHFVAGSTTTYGTGNYRFSLPFTAGANGDCVGQGLMQDSGGNSYPIAVFVFAAESIARPWQSAAVTGAAPMSWSTNDVVDMMVRYHTAISA